MKSQEERKAFKISGKYVLIHTCSNNWLFVLLAKSDIEGELNPWLVNWELYPVQQ